MSEQTNTFIFGFVLGTIFGYSGIVGFLGGFITGILFLKTYGKTEIPIRKDIKEEVYKRFSRYITL